MLTEDRLTRDFTILQRAKGHRFSSDDMVTAYVAVHSCNPSTILDLGCGIGSVLLHLAWSFPAARLVGIEAQAISFDLLQQNIAKNAVGDRVTVHQGDLRDGLIPGPFDLVTGTPPYFRPDTAVDAMDEQRAFARIEYRGGIDDYVRAGARVLAPDGTLVLCGDARTEDRLAAAAHQAGLHVVARTGIVAHAPKPPLFCVWTLRHDFAPRIESTLTLRDAEGRTTPDAAMLRAFSGF